MNHGWPVGSEHEAECDWWDPYLTGPKISRCTSSGWSHPNRECQGTLLFEFLTNIGWGEGGVGGGLLSLTVQQLIYIDASVI